MQHNRFSTERKYKFLTNVTVNGVKILILIFLAKVFAIEDFGIYIFIFTLVEMANVISNLGLPTTITNYISKNKNNPRVVRAYIFYGLNVKFVTTVVINLILSFYLLFLSPIGELTYFLVFSIFVWSFFNTFFSYLEYIFAGLFDYRSFFLKSVLVKEALFILIISFLFYWNLLDINNVVLAYGISISIPITIQLISLIFYFKQYEKINIQKKQFIYFALSLAPTTVAGAILYWTDTIMITYFLDVGKVGEFNAVYRLIAIGVTIFPITSVVALSHFNTLNETSRQSSVNEIFKKLSSIIVILIIALTWFAQEIITIVYGENFIGAYPILAIGSFLLFERLLSPILKYYLIIKNKQMLINKYMFIGTLINIGLNSIAIPILGITGAILTTIISSYTIFGLMMIYISKNYFKLKVKSLIIFMGLSIGFIVISFVLSSVILQVKVIIVVSFLYLYLILLKKFNIVKGFKLKDTLKLLKK